MPWSVSVSMDTYDVVVVGSGAGGATLARELCRWGFSVCVVERGLRHDIVGGAAHAAAYTDTVVSKEGVPIHRAIMAGGTTIISAGNMVPCLEGPLRRRGIDISGEVRALQEELPLSPLLPSMCHEATEAVARAGAAAGMPFEPLVKGIDPSRCDGCGLCLTGCATGAKWTALSFLDEAVWLGASVRYGARCTQVLVQTGRATGIEIETEDGISSIGARNVVLCAGGLETPVILQKSGIDAGRHLSVDLLSHVYGIVKGRTFSRELPMTLVCTARLGDEGYILSPSVNARAVSRHFSSLGRTDVGVANVLGLMIKIRDSGEGRVFPDGTVSKRVTDADRKIFERARDAARRVLIAAGAEPDTLFETSINGAHPLGTAAIGEVVSPTLETRVSGLYVCDASVLPEAPGLPPILTIMALALRLAAHLADRA